jgi:transposase
MEAYFRCSRGKIAQQFVLDRQHDCESASRGQRRKRGEKNQAIGISRGGRTTKIHAVVDGKGRPLNFSVTGGQVHDSQVVEDVLNTPRSPLVVTADKAYDSQTARQQIKDEGALPIIPNRRNAIKQAYCPKRFYRQRHKSKTSSVVSRIGGASPPATTNSLEISLPPQPSSAHPIGSSCESRP